MEKALLREVPLFSDLSEDEILSLAAVTVTRRFPKNALILMEEEEGDSMFVISHGRVKVSLIGEDGTEVILSLLGPGQFFGEMSLLDGKPRSATVTATEDSELILLRRCDFLRATEQIPRIAVKLLASLTARLRRADHQIENLALRNVAGRVAATLLQMAEEEGTQTQEGILITDRPTHQDLGNMAGTTRETVSRVLKKFEQEGFTVNRGRDVIIANEQGLRDRYLCG